MWTSFKRQIWQLRSVLVVAPGIAGLTILLRLSGSLQGLEWAAFDQMMRLRPHTDRDTRIAIVGIDEIDLRRFGNPLIPDGTLAKALKIIRAQQPVAIGLDIYRDLPVEPGHQELVSVFESTPNLLGVEKVGGPYDRQVAPPPALKARQQTRAIDLVIDADGKVRRGLLYLTPQGDESLFGLGFSLAWMYLNQQGLQTGLTDQGLIQMHQTVIWPFTGNEGGYVRVDASGYQVLLNYRGGRNHFEMVSLSQVLDGQLPPDWARDRIILVGTVAESVKDFFRVPYVGQMAGVEVHANLTSQLISTVLDGRSLIKTWMEPIEWGWILLWSVVGAIVSRKLGYVGSSGQRLPQAALYLLLAGISFVGICSAAFLLGWWLPVVPPAIALMGSAVTMTAVIAQNAFSIRNIFSRYLSDAVVNDLLETPTGLKLGGDRKKVTILMSDLRGFSGLSEELPPEQVVSMLNLYLEAMIEVITRYKGTIDEFIGDAILVVFGAPTQRVDDAHRAVACAIEMQLAMQQVNQKLQQRNLPEIAMGIGLNTGEVVAGNIGSQKRAKYAVIGSSVNLASRIESYTTGGQILISESTLMNCGNLVKTGRKMTVQPKGMKQSIAIYEVVGIAGIYNLSLPTLEAPLFALDHSLPIQYIVLKGKHVTDDLLPGSMTKLSSQAAEVKLHQPIATLSNIKIHIALPTNQSAEINTLYAKVIDQVADDPLHYHIRFTSMPPDFAALLRSLLPPD